MSSLAWGPSGSHTSPTPSKDSSSASVPVRAPSVNMLNANPMLSGDSEVAAVRAFNDQMAGVAGLNAVIVPIGDGLWIGVKR